MTAMRDVRLARLRVLLHEEKEKRKVLAARIKKSPAQVSQWLSGYRTITEETAREIERNASKPKGWLDTLDAAISAEQSPGRASITGTVPPPPPSLGVALPVVLDALDGLSPSRWAMARAALDQLVTRPDLRDEAEAELLALLTAPPSKRGAHP